MFSVETNELVAVLLSATERGGKSKSNHRWTNASLILVVFVFHGRSFENLSVI